MKQGGSASGTKAVFGQALTSRLRGVYPGWWVILACAAIGAYGGGVYFYGFTLFFNPLKDDLGLTSAQTSLVFSLTRLEGAFEGVVVGYLVDRFGGRRVMMVGIPVAGIGFLVWATWVDSYLMFILVYVGLVAMGINAGFFHPGLAIANNWFIRRRAMAMAVIGVSLGFGGAILVPLLAIAIDSWGWRTAAFLAGIGLLVLIWPFTLLVHHSPEQRGLLPDGYAQPHGHAAQSGEQGNPLHATEVAAVDPPSLLQETNYGLAEAFRTRVMWLLLPAMTIRFFVHTAIMVHLAPLLIDRGMSAVAAGGSVGLLALLTIPGRLMSGWLGDRLAKRKVVACLVMADVLAMIILSLATSAWQLYLFIFVWACGYGAGLLNWALIGDYFGRARFATIRGLMGAVFSIGAVLGPLYAGWVYDTTGAYSQAIVLFIGMNVVAVTLYWISTPPRPRYGAPSTDGYTSAESPSLAGPRPSMEHLR